MIAPDMFQVFIVQPILNVLILVLALLPGHNFGLAIILFTIIVRIALLPLLRKQLHHTKAMRELQPELKRIKKEAKGDKTKESQLVMELYREREINPFASLGLVLLQLPILIALYVGLKKIIDNPGNIVELAYGPIKELPYLKDLTANIKSFDQTLVGVVDLTRSAVSQGVTYWPAMILALGSAVIQYFQSKQLMPDQKDSKTIRQILKESSEGKQADQSEMNAAVSRLTIYMIPAFIFIASIGFPSALPLYWLVSGMVAYIQQGRILKEDEVEMESISREPAIKKPKSSNKTKTRNHKPTKKTVSKSKKRR